MGLKETVIHLRQILTNMHRDLDKAGRGNCTAAQRVRTNSIKFAKIAKTYRKESMAEQKKANATKKTKKRKK